MSDSLKKTILDATHDMKNVLAIIKMSIYMVKKKQESIEKLDGKVDELTKIITDLEKQMLS